MPDEPLEFLAATPTPVGGEDAPVGAGDPAPGTVPSIGVFLPEDGGGAYTHFGLTITVAYDSGLAYAPTAGGPRSKTVFWRVSGATSLKIIAFAVSRFNAVPRAPHVDTGTANDVLINVQYSLPVKEILPDGSERITLVGQYLYAQSTPIDPLAPTLIPNSALNLPELAQIDPSTFSRQLTGPVNPPSDYDGTTVTF